jgi:uncharacterized membrane protein
MHEVENKEVATKGNLVRCYLAGILFPIAFLTTAPYKSERLVRFHSFQSIIFTAVWGALTITTNTLQFQMRGVSALLSGLWLLCLVMWVVLMLKAYKRKKFKLPVIGQLAERWAG